jgi:hypothetical protein
MVEVIYGDITVIVPSGEGAYSIGVPLRDPYYPLIGPIEASTWRLVRDSR